MAISTPISAEEFEQLSRDSEARLECFDGEVIESSSPRLSHNLILRVLMVKVGAFDLQNTNGLWIFGSEYRLNSERRVMPDLAFLRAPKHLLLDVDASPIELIPDIAIEVISPSEMARDLERKITAYLDAGVSEVWTLYPESQHIYVHQADTSKLFKSGDKLASSVLPGWSCSVSEIFAI